MKFLFIYSVIFLLLPFYNVVAENSPGCPVIPAPQVSEKAEGRFEISDATQILYEASLFSQANYLQYELLKHTGIAARLNDNPHLDDRGSKIVLRLQANCEEEKDASEAYSLKMNEEEITIISNSSNGIFHGLTTLIQLTRLSAVESNSISIDCWNIQDKPEFEWRGFMLDESRHFFGMNKVKQLLDWMALYKLNKFHWHLTDSQGWRLEIKQYPKLAVVGGVGNYTNKYAEARYYTQEEIKEIVKYASERFIEIIPEIDMPGHASAANRAYPEYSGGGSEKRPDFTFNPGKESVYSYLTNILKEVDVLFPSQVIHLGGDEVHYGNDKWGSDEAIQNLMKREELNDLTDVEHYFFRRMSDSLFNLNNKLAAWDEIAGSDIDPEKTIVYFWRPNRLDQLQKSLDKGYSIVMSPRLPMYLDYAQDTLQMHGVPWKKFGVHSYDKIYNFNPYSYDVNYPDDSRIIGIQANMWTERVETEDRLDYQIFPRLAALAETAWTKGENKNLDDFNDRLKKQFNLYRLDKIYYYDPFDPKTQGEPIR